jgi:hypothetical protein
MKLTRSLFLKHLYSNPFLFLAWDGRVIYSVRLAKRMTTSSQTKGVEDSRKWVGGRHRNKRKWHPKTKKSPLSPRYVATLNQRENKKKSEISDIHPAGRNAELIFFFETFHTHAIRWIFPFACWAALRWSLPGTGWLPAMVDAHGIDGWWTGT